ncbi:MAG: hypothetical protein AAF909_08925, partial [Pseudomonadota bacterium]
KLTLIFFVGILSQVPRSSLIVTETGAIRLGAGEHGGYSRVTVSGAPAGGWTLMSGARRFDLRLPGGARALNADAVTKHRRAHRVAAMRQRREGEDTVLSFDLTCDCSAAARVTGTGLLVIDVNPRAPIEAPNNQADGDRQTAEAAGEIETATTPRTAPLDVEGARNFLMLQLQRAADQGLIQYREPAGAVAAAASRPAAAQTEDALNAAATDAPERAAPIDEPARQGTAEEASERPASPRKGRAARRLREDATVARSGVEPAPQAPLSSARPRAPEPARAVETRDGEPRPTGAESAPADTASMAQRSAVTALQRAEPQAQTPAPPLTPTPAVATPAAAPAPCPVESLIDPSAWPVNQPYFEALSERRGVLFDSVNRVDPAAVAGLQRLYLAQGFGLEAAAVPAAFNVDDPEVTLLAAIGAALAGRAPAADDPFNRPRPCPGRQALWQAVALADVDPERAVTAFRLAGPSLLRTPSALRRMIGERIALAAVRAGSLELAAAILSLLERSQLEPTATMRIARAALAMVDGRVVAAQTELETVARSRDPLAFEATLRLAESFAEPYEAGRALDVADLLADFGLQRRGGPEMVAAVSAEARLRARFGRLPEALTALDLARRYGGFGEDQLRALQLELMRNGLNAVATAVADQSGGTKGAGALGDASERLALAAQLVEAAGGLEAAPDFDQIRIDLTTLLKDLDASHLAGLVIDDALAARAPNAAKALADAQAAAALIDPLGALAEGPDALTASAPRVRETGDLRRDGPLPEFPAPENDARRAPEAADPAGDEPVPPPAADRLAPLRDDAWADRNPETIEDGQQLIADIDADLTLIRSLAAGGGPNE